MASARSVRAGRGFIELFLKDSALLRGLDKIGARLKSIGRRIAAAGAAITAFGGAVIGPIVLAAREFAKFGDAIDKTSARVGVSASALSQLQFAAEQTGSDLPTLEKGFAGLSRSIFDMGRNSAEAVHAFSRMNISFQDLQGLSPEQQFEKVADGLASIQDLSTRGAVAQRVFGRAGRQLLPLFAQGAAGIRDLRQEADRLGLTISQSQAGAAARLTDAWNRVISTFRGVRLQIGAVFADSIAKVADRIAKTATIVIGFVKVNGQLIISIAKAAAAVAGIGAAIAFIGISIVSLGALFASFSVILGVIGSVLSGIGAVVAAVVSPIGLLTVGVGALLAALVKLSGGGSAVLSILADNFGTLFDRTKKAFEGIKNALAGGDIALAARVLWLALKLEFGQGIRVLTIGWINFKTAFLKIGVDLFTGFLKVAAKAFANVQKAYVGTTTAIALATDFAITQAKNLAERALGTNESVTAAAIERRNAALEERAKARLRAANEKLKGIETNLKTQVGFADLLKAGAQTTILKRQEGDLRKTNEQLNGVRAEYAKALAEASKVGKDKSLFKSIPDSLKNTLSQLANSVNSSIGERANAAFAGDISANIFGKQEDTQVSLTRQQLLELRKANALLDKINKKNAGAATFTR